MDRPNKQLGRRGSRWRPAPELSQTSALMHYVNFPACYRSYIANVVQYIRGTQLLGHTSTVWRELLVFGSGKLLLAGIRYGWGNRRRPVRQVETIQNPSARHSEENISAEILPSFATPQRFHCTLLEILPSGLDGLPYEDNPKHR